MNNLYKKFDARLSALLRHLVPCNTTADVGCDHGLVSLYVLDANISNNVVCIDISPKCLQKTQNLLQKTKLQDRAVFLQSDGLHGTEEILIDQVVIAGMGGINISNILKAMPKSSDNARLILQPMNNITMVRKTLNNLNKAIIRDEIIFDKNKYYHIIVAQNGKQKLTKQQVRCGAVTEDYRSADYQKWLDLKIKKVESIINGIPKDNEKYPEFIEYLNDLKKCKF